MNATWAPVLEEGTGVLALANYRKYCHTSGDMSAEGCHLDASIQTWAGASAELTFFEQGSCIHKARFPIPQQFKKPVTGDKESDAVVAHSQNTVCALFFLFRARNKRV